MTREEALKIAHTAHLRADGDLDFRNDVINALNRLAMEGETALAVGWQAGVTYVLEALSKPNIIRGINVIAAERAEKDDLEALQSAAIAMGSDLSVHPESHTGQLQKRVGELEARPETFDPEAVRALLVICQRFDDKGSCFSDELTHAWKRVRDSKRKS